jgi:hypothetical protein
MRELPGFPPRWPLGYSTTTSTAIAAQTPTPGSHQRRARPAASLRGGVARNGAGGANWAEADPDGGVAGSASDGAADPDAGTRDGEADAAGCRAAA